MSPRIDEKEITDATAVSSQIVEWALLAIRSWRLLVAGSLLVGLFGVTGGLLWPKIYTSTTTLQTNEAGARSAAEIIGSPAVLNNILTKYPDLPGATIDEQRERLALRIRFEVSPGETRRTANLFYLRVEDRDPVRAQSISNIALDTLFELVKPRGRDRAVLEERLARFEGELEKSDEVIKRIEVEATSLIMPNSLQGEVATSIAGLRDKREKLAEEVSKIRRELRGAPTRDIVLTAPSLPVEFRWSRVSVLLFSSAPATLVLLLIYVVLFRPIVIEIVRRCNAPD